SPSPQCGEGVRGRGFHSLQGLRQFHQLHKLRPLYRRLDETTRTNEKVAALVEYFQTAPPERAAYALSFLTGNRVKRAVNTRLLREWAAEAAGIPLWLLEESYHHVGDLAETLALILPDPKRPTEYPLDRLVEERILPLPNLTEDERKESIQRTWEELVPDQRFLFHKLLGGGFRVGVSKNLVTRSLGQVSGLDSAVIAHRMMGEWRPSATTYLNIITEEESAHEVGKPYPFYLAYPLEQSPTELGPIEDWQAEWKWDGIRAQLIRRKGETILWSRGEEMLTERFPDIIEPAALIPDGAVLDGEVLCWREGKPLPFAQLQKRIGRKRVGKKILEDAPAAFMAYDVLEWNGEDIREKPLSERRGHLEDIASDWKPMFPFILSKTIQAENWEELENLREEARDRGVEGMMLKRLSSPYQVGRRRGDWWKWKIEPLHIDAVMIYAQSGHGRRSN
ncbi:MAG: cisplatin damage response ATP-dependent DNA ligase, partial [Candidatus Omnitrophica bacterium]|nr:cisplatin damage response ATP-dependent DNA ligase [Candidatus Omnitrophota bacterium]